MAGFRGKYFPDSFPQSIVGTYKVVWKHYPKGRCGAQQHCPKNILLRIKPRIPSGRIIRGPEDIVDVDQDAGSKARQYVEKQRRHIGVGEYAMRAIKKQDIAGKKFTVYESFGRRLSRSPRVDSGRLK